MFHCKLKISQQPNAMLFIELHLTINFKFKTNYSMPLRRQYTNTISSNVYYKKTWLYFCSKPSLKRSFWSNKTLRPSILIHLALKGHTNGLGSNTPLLNILALNF